MPTSFSNKKRLRIVITLGTGTFGSSTNNQITMEGFRATVDIDLAGLFQMGTLRAQVFGMSQEDINSATTLQWKPGYTINGNKIDVYAIDGAQETLVFSGNIVNAWANYQNAPDVYLNIQAQTAYHSQLTPVAPRSYKGAIDAASAMAQIASGMGMTFENTGVTVQLSNLYLAGTGLDQAKYLAKAAGIDLYVDGTVLAITPPNVARGGLIPEISPQSGLEVYPTFDGVGVNFQTLYNPAIRFGGSIKLVTSLPQAAGTWIVTSLSHRLESEKPNGVWMSQVRGNVSGLSFAQ